MAQKYGLHWFRRDLRIAGNENLRQNWKKNDQRVLGVFCFDSTFLGRADFSHNRFGFFLKTLAQLQTEMRAQGGDLLVINARPDDAFQTLFTYLNKQPQGLPSLVSFGHDYEPFARERDARLLKFFASQGVATLTDRDHVLIEPHEILKDNGELYQIYTPYAKRWFEKLQTPQVQARLEAQKSIDRYYERLQSHDFEKIFAMNWNEFRNLPFSDSLAAFTEENNKHVTVPLPEAGFGAAYKRLLEFKKQVSEYSEQRDTPSLSGTSLMSIYQKNGSIVSSQIISTLGLGQKQMSSPGGATQYIKEIAWREFYYSILFHRPDSEKQSFLPQYRKLAWENDEKFFKRWCEGTTGFPIVDAGMRQLNQTGWMHNRVRMIVASFLVKDLLIDWRWGENYFMKMLIDGDLAPNNGGWQWAASTGCDPQPYFRIFNPWLQAQRFDADAAYIKKYIPELRGLKAQQIHDPDKLEEARTSLLAGEAALYPAPVVDHAVQKEKAIQLFKNARG